MHTRGYTLLELLVVLTLLGLLLTLGLPDLRRWQREAQSEALLVELGRLLAEARGTAVTQGVPVTLCSSITPPLCDAAWQRQALLFTDHDGDRVFDRTDGDLMLRHWTPPEAQGRLLLSNFPARPSLQFLPTGFTSGESGNFTWCPPNAEPSAIRQLIFTRSGRTRMALDTNGDGIREGADGQPLSCP
ncbi:MAG: GspH/FimT family protein [Pseudomonadales bacterium]|jgi:type IV fimbrial biogenesis protein FimT|nr:GspH/FimT family protein [Pseudomonadales bacterium]